LTDIERQLTIVPHMKGVGHSNVPAECLIG